MNIQLLDGCQGAEKAIGLTVIIDVFRAFSLEAYFFHQNAKTVMALSDLNLTYQIKKEHPSYILCGERNGAKCEGFDYGNSPSAIDGVDFTNQTILHTTSAGTQGLSLAAKATECITGAFVNARAIAAYIQQNNPDDVSLVAMGWNGVRKSEEDSLCAMYIESLLKGEPISDIAERVDALRFYEGKKFFDPLQQSIFPKGDFQKCTAIDIFPFIIRAHKREDYFLMEKEEIMVNA